MGFIWLSKGEIRNNNLKISSKIVNKSHKAMCVMQKGSQANRDKKKKTKMADIPVSPVDPSPPLSFCGMDVLDIFPQSKAEKKIRDMA